MPTSTTVNPTKDSYTELDMIKTIQYKAFLVNYKHKVSKHDQQATALQGMCTFIQGTIFRNYFTFMMNCDNAYEILTTLKCHIILMDQIRKMKLLAKYQRLKKALRI